MRTVAESKLCVEGSKRVMLRTRCPRVNALPLTATATSAHFLQRVQKQRAGPRTGPLAEGKRYLPC